MMICRDHRSLGFMLAVLIIAGGAGWAVAAEQTSPGIDLDVLADQINNVFRNAVGEVIPAVVFIQVTRDLPFGHPGGPLFGAAGTGFIIDKRGYVVTNNHVVADSKSVEVELADGRRFRAEEVFVDEDSEIAVIRIDPGDQDLPVARFGDSEQSQVGDIVLAIGNPFGYHLRQTVTSGIISHKGRQTNILDNNWSYEDFIQTDADINRGNSGGPLVNLHGEVIGVNTMIISSTGLSAGVAFAIPSNLAKFVVGELIENKKVRRGYLGVGPHRYQSLDELRKQPIDTFTIDDELAQVIKTLPESIQGALIRTVQPDSPAEEAGMERYDIIVKLAGRKMNSWRQFHNFVATLAPSSTVECIVWRDGKEIELQITLGDRNVAKARDRERQRIIAQALPPSPRWFPRLAPPEEPLLGVGVVELNSALALIFGYDPATQGVVIVEVTPGTLAAKYDLQTGSIIVSIDGEQIETATQLKRIIRAADLDDKGIELTLRNADGVQVDIGPMRR